MTINNITDMYVEPHKCMCLFPELAVVIDKFPCNVNYTWPF